MNTSTQHVLTHQFRIKTTEQLDEWGVVYKRAINLMADLLAMDEYWTPEQKAAVELGEELSDIAPFYYHEVMRRVRIIEENQENHRSLADD
jgi:hypothetical protein